MAAGTVTISATEKTIGDTSSIATLLSIAGGAVIKKPILFKSGENRLMLGIVAEA